MAELARIARDAALFPEAIGAALAIALLCGALSALVVLRRLAFIGQGVSHAAFGAAGLAAALGLAGAGAGAPAYYLVVGGFCVATALGIARVGRRRGAERGLPEDTVIGLFLVGSMAAGALLLRWAATNAPPGQPLPGVEAWLFGSILSVGRSDALVAWGVTLCVLAALWWWRRAILFWAFDEEGAAAFGVETDRVRALVLVLLAVAIVVSMRLAGVLLATALLVLPGATALRLGDRLGVVLALSVGAALAGMLGGLGLAFAADWPPGPSVVVAQIALFAAATLAGALGRSGRSSGRAGGDDAETSPLSR